MPNTYPRKGTRFIWCWGFDANGKRWDESTKQTDPKAAKLAAREIERRYAADPGHKEKSRLTLKYALELVQTYQRESNKAPATLRATHYHARHLIELLAPDTPISSITLADTTKYMRKRIKDGAHPHTVLKEIKTLTQAMRRCEKLGIYRPERGPSHYIPDELSGVYEPRKRWLPRDEYERLLAAMRNRYRKNSIDRSDYVIAWCNLGVRKAELFDIQPGDYDAKRRELRVRGTKTEGADRLVPVNDEVAEVLDRRCQLDKPFPVWADGNCTRDLANACKRAKIAKVSPNDLRRTFCSWLCQAGVTERVCAELMGHESTVMVRSVYGHLDRAAMAAAVAQISSSRVDRDSAAAPAADDLTSGAEA